MMADDYVIGGYIFQCEIPGWDDWALDEGIIQDLIVYLNNINHKTIQKKKKNI